MSVPPSVNQPNPGYTIAPSTMPAYNPSLAIRSTPMVQAPAIPRSDPSMDKLRGEMQKMIYENFGIEPKPAHLTYQKPYLDYFDMVPYPQGFKVPDFVKFNGVDSKTTWEHISQYLAQLAEAGNSDPIKVRLFPLSLTGTAFSWFSALAPGSVLTWYHLAKKFHEHFYTGENELKLSHLTSVKQRHDESVSKYVKRFRDTKNRCYSLVTTEKDTADLVITGLKSYLREKMEGFEFRSVSQVLQRSMAYESRANDSK